MYTKIQQVVLLLIRIFNQSTWCARVALAERYTAYGTTTKGSDVTKCVPSTW